MELSAIDTIRLTRFKSFRQAELRLSPLTVLVGRNGSGKSNALDGLWTLSRLAEGEDIRQALDGGVDGPAVRGGAAGCAPLGETAFSLGCEVRTGQEIGRLDVTVQVEPVVQITSERLSMKRADDPAGPLPLLTTDPPDASSGYIVANWRTSRRGRSRKMPFRASRLLTAQVQTRIPAGDEAGLRVHRAAGQVLSALRGVFVLDPIPHLMRQYVSSRDAKLRRNAANLSAAVADVLTEPAGARRLRESLGAVNEQEVVRLEVARSELDDVMLTLYERWGEREHLVPARLMSDGSLRFLAIVLALIQSRSGSGADAGPALSADYAALTTLVVEELENSLHASQATMLVGLVREYVSTHQVRVLATTHSPALLDALDGQEHRGVVVCQRDPHGWSVLHPLTELVGYLRMVAAGGLGRAAVDDRLRAADVSQKSATELLDEVLRRPPA